MTRRKALLQDIHEALKPLREGKRDGGTMGKLSEIDDAIIAELSVKKAPLDVYSMVDRGPKEKALWTKIGSAFVNSNGSINVFLNYMPIDGKIQIREGKKTKGEE